MRARSSLARGAAALATSQVLAPLLQAVQLAVVARFVTPADLGGWVVPAIVLAGEALLLEFGFHAVLARRPLADDAALARRWAGAATVAHLAVVIVGVLADSSWTSLALVLLPVAPLSALSSIGRSRLAHREQFTRVARIELEAAALSTLTACALVATAGIASLAIAAVVRSTYLAAVVRTEARRDTETVAGEREAHLVMASYVFLFAAGNVDYALATHLLPSAAIGSYFLAFNIANAPATRISLAANRLIVTRLGSDEPRRVTMVLFLLGAGGAVGVCAGAGALPAVLGDDWRSAVEPARVLGSVVTAVIVGNGLRGIAIAERRDRRVLTASALSLALTIAVVLAVGPTTASDLARVVAVTQVASLGTWLWTLAASTRREVAAAVGNAAVFAAAGLTMASTEPALTVPLTAIGAIAALLAHRALVRQVAVAITGR